MTEQQEIPRNWAQCSLKEIVFHRSGDSSLIKGKLHQEPGDGLYSAFSASGQDVWRENYHYEGPGVVISAVGARCGKAFLATGQWSAIANTHVVFPKEDVADTKFIWYLLNDEHFWIKGGSGQPFVRVKQSFQRPFLLPPINEQRRIVAKIEELFSELDDSVANLETARTQLQTYRQSLLKHAFEGRLTQQWREQARSVGGLTPVDQMLKCIEEIPRPNRWNSRSRDVIIGHSCLAVGNPETPLPSGWKWVQLADVARMESGHTPSRRHPEWWDGDIPWIGIADAKDNNGRVISETKQHTNNDGLENSAARLLPKGTVCVSRTASVGYVVEMGTEMATSQDFVNWVPSTAVTGAWLRLIFGAHREYLLRFGKGTTHKTIYFPEWLSVHIGLPPIEEQRQITDDVESKLSELDAMDASVYYAVIKTETIRQSILKHAFEGGLVPQDPDDEPASELLARIRGEE